jgi:hypothetical protein
VKRPCTAALREGALCSRPALLACSARRLGPNPNLGGSFLFLAEEGLDGSKMSDSSGGKFVYLFFTSSLSSYHPLLPFPLMIPNPNLGAGFLILAVLVIVLHFVPVVLPPPIAFSSHDPQPQSWCRLDDLKTLYSSYVSLNDMCL